MAETTPLSLDDLHEKLQEVLIRWPLYRSLYYHQNGCHQDNPHIRDQRVSSLPSLLSMFCNNILCKKETWWSLDYSTVSFDSDFIKRRTYKCKNCGASYYHYLFIWQEKENGAAGLFIKVGQYPPLAIEPIPELAKALGKVDSELYKKALIAANFSHGIGAVAYFRRVLENKINMLLDLIAEAAKNAQIAPELILELEKVKQGRVVEDRIAFASKLLPPHLRPGGHNPLDKLYKMASAGLHGESDEECLEIFAEGKFVFEYLFKNLTVENEEAREYLKQLSSPFRSKKSSTSDNEVKE